MRKAMVEKSLILNLPDALARELQSAHQDLLVELLERGLKEMRIDRALDLYSRGGMSFGAAAERAGVSRSDLARHAYARGMEPPFTPETLTEELG
jgi:predicted HTH domain antitoxin